MTRAAAPLQSAAPTSSGRLAIGAMRLRVRHGQGQLPPRMPDGTALAKAMREALTGLVDPADGSFWVIRSLRLPSGACDKSDASVLAALVAAQVGKALRKVLRGELVEGVRRFPDRSAWLAELMLDHVRGAARGHWLYASRSGYDAVPPQLVPRMVLLDDPATAIEAFALMQRSGQLADLVARMGEPGARAAWPALLRAARMQAQGQTSVGFAPQTSEPATAFAGKPHSQALLAIARAIATDGCAALPAEAEVRRHILQQQAALRVVPVRSGSPGPDPQALGAPQRAGSDPKFPKPAAGAEPADRSAERRSDPADLAAEVIDTAHAGVFLLWRSVVEMGLEALFPPRANPGAARLTLAAALAGPDRKAAWSDPALHWLADHAPGEGEQPVAADTDWPRRLLAHWQDWRAPRPVVPSLRRLGASWLLQDRETEDWLALGTARECRRAAEATGSRPGAPAGDARDPVQDFTWFGAARRHDRLWAVLARFAYADLARRLGGLERSSAHWLSVNLLTGWGRLLPGDPGVIVLPRAPLDLVLRMSGMGGTAVNCGSGRRFLIQLAGPG